MKKLSYSIVLALTLGLVLTGCFLSNVGQVPTSEQSGITYLTKGLPSGLVGWWRFSEEEGDIAYDSSVYGNDGTVFGAEYVSSTVGMGQALSFDGSDYVIVDDSDTLDITDEITIEAWINPTSVDGYRTIVSKRSGSVADYALRLWGGKVEFYYRRAGAITWSEWCTNIAPVSAENPYHIAVTYTFGDGDSIRVYVNDTSYGGVWLYGVSEYVTANTYPVYIGYNYPGYPQPFKGIIDDVRIWNVALSEGQLGKIYDFDGFFPPIDDDVSNVVKAGRAIPVKFSLNGDQGLEIFDENYPLSKEIVCNLGDLVDDEEIITVTAGGSSLNYDADADQYIYVWKTEKDWAGTCRQLIVKLIDGTYHSANFTFK